MKRILFPTDFSEVATNAFVHALEFAKQVKGELVLLHTFEIPVYDSQFFPENFAIIYNSLELSKFEMFKDQIPKLREIAEGRNLDDIVMNHRLMDGDLVYNMKKAIKEDNIDFVVMGTSGISGWENFFLGTNTDAVISGVEVPILCVPGESEFKKVKTIGFTTRYREKDKKELHKVLTIAKKMNAKVKCLYVRTQSTDVSDATIKEWEADFKDEPIQFLVLPCEEVKETILDFVLYKDIDVLAMIAYKRSFFESLFHPSFTKKLTKDIAIPVLIMHEQ
ncbi:universal stress protein [Flavobacterium sp. PL02]|jgi:nucleotide-binding universal stress UspA family protein|uniref:universal stress protein n=1 Tax=Flavobacterium sp. PL02 TaxID=3088354 RepID=UPI00057CE30E|nr:universal stress protein [Flavobacterium sp. PL02]KIC01260.1 universal stress protein UspA [Flavobacterium sp. JRM]MEA9415838.1 universal stress protein [Flavobacterium sp. PL02]